MHYYKRNLGDYAKKAGRLSMLQHGSYTLLIDACYDREKFPTLAEAIEWTWASTTEEKEAVEFVLNRFFDLEDGVFVQKRIQEEITEYHEKAETNRRIAIEREAIRKEKETNRARTVNDTPPVAHASPPNHKPITTNQEPSIKPKPRAASASRFEEFWNSWPKSERKQDKSKCLAKWAADKLDDKASEILLDIATKKSTQKWQGGFIEAPVVYLNNKRWEDGVTPDQLGQAAVTDPESRASIEADGEARGLGRWDEASEQWHAYKARVRGRTAPSLSLNQLSAMAGKRQGVPA